jgi:hypothetical protein
MPGTSKGKKPDIRPRLLSEPQETEQALLLGLKLPCFLAEGFPIIGNRKVYRGQPQILAGLFMFFLGVSG